MGTGEASLGSAIGSRVPRELGRDVLCSWFIPEASKPLANNPTEEVKPRHGAHLVFQLPPMSVPGLCMCLGEL